MTKSTMVSTIKERYNEALELSYTWSDMLDKKLEKIGKTFKEALEDDSIYEIIDYRIWLQYSQEADVLEALMKSLQIEYK